MPEAFSFRPGARVLWRRRPHVIVQAVTASSVLVEDEETRQSQVAPVNELRPVESPDKAAPSKLIDAISPEDLEIARKRMAIIKPLVTVQRRRHEDVEKAALAAGVSTPTIYRWIRTYEGRRLLSDLAPNRKGRTMPKQLDSRIEAIITSVIQDLYLTKQKVSGKKAIDEVHRRCRAAGLPKPSTNTIRVRLRAIDAKEKTLKREGRKAARDKFGQNQGRFPGADYPLSVIQIDHTLLDVIIVDEENRIDIGRPWLTLAIDVYSRMVFGYHLSHDNPSAFSVGLCLSHGILDKSATLEELGVKGEWPVWGKPDVVHADNGKDFRSHTIKDALEEYGIDREFRPVKTPHYGGHIERLCGTLARKIHELPGTTFSNPRQRGEYKSGEKAVMTRRQLEQWLVNLIIGVYHNSFHEGIQCPPIARWNEGILGNERRKGRGLPEPIPDPRRLRITFLPYSERVVQKDGIVWDHIWYQDKTLASWVKAESDGRPRKFRVRRDPTDISKLYFFDPLIRDYVEIPYRNWEHPSISLWDYRAIRNYMREQGMAAVNEDAIFAAHEEMHRITQEAGEETKRARRKGAKAREKQRHRATLTLDPPADRDPTPKPAKSAKEDRLKLVVDNAKPAKRRKAPEGDDDHFVIDAALIKKGVEEW